MTIKKLSLLILLLTFLPITANAAMPSLNFTVNMSENVIVNTTGGTPTIALTVDDKPRFATYASGTGTNALTFTYAPTVGDVDLDGITITSPYNIILNSGTIKDAAGNNASLSFTPPVTTGVKVNYPSLSMDFVYDADGRYTLNGNPRDTLSAFLTDAGGSFTRASIGTYFDSTGTLQTAAANTPRFDYDPVTHAAKGILIEEARTNYIKNSQFSGISTATYSSTTTVGNWQFSPSGGQISIASTGTSNGIPYIDIRFQKTNSSGATQFMNFNTLSADRAPVTNGKTTTFSTWLGVTSYSSTGGTCLIVASNRSYTAAGSYISETQVINSSTTTYARVKTPVLTHGATAGLAEGWIYATVPNGVTCDATVRLGGPQFEIGSFPTSYIPTTSAIVTRAADTLDIPKGTWFNEGLGTIYAESYTPKCNNGFCRTVGLAPSNKSLVESNGLSNIETWSGISGQVFGTAISPTPTDTIYGHYGFAWNTTLATRSFVANGASVATQSSFPGDYTTTSIRIGSGAGGDHLNNAIRKIKYYPLRVTDTQLQLLTQ